MSAKDQMASGMMQAILKTLPTEYEIQNPVSQFLCDAIDKVLVESSLVDTIKAQAVKRSNNDPNGVLQQLVTLHNDGVLIRFHNDIEEFVKGLNEAEAIEGAVEDVVKEINEAEAEAPDDDPDPE